jgi:hypothetical protein
MPGAGCRVPVPNVDVIAPEGRRKKQPSAVLPASYCLDGPAGNRGLTVLHQLQLARHLLQRRRVASLQDFPDQCSDRYWAPANDRHTRRSCLTHPTTRSRFRYDPASHLTEADAAVGRTRGGAGEDDIVAVEQEGPLLAFDGYRFPATPSELDEGASLVRRGA